MSHILVTGGAGYIGSHTSRHLLAAGYQIVVLDNLYSGHRWAVPDEAIFIEGDAGSIETVDALFKEYTISAIVHFAGHIVVPESVEDPLKYYENNCVVTQTLATQALKHGVEHMIFSSSAAVYGEPDELPVTESTLTNPISPYGRTKLISEWMLEDVSRANEQFDFVALRYFNVAGAALDGSLGQSTPEATHLIKVACELVTQQRDKIALFGTDYPTEDGTCVRDYIHIEDLAAAHVSALRYLQAGGGSNIFNCGYGQGFSVQQVLDCVAEIAQKDLNIETTGRRLGDPAELIANNDKILQALDWLPKHNDIRLICETALNWERHLASQHKNV
ncbi:MAG: UDP-glucose 4-epimerase GalE [Arenicella sp.]